jgi:hypothetical protein
VKSTYIYENAESDYVMQSMKAYISMKKERMKRKQSVNKLKKMMNIVTRSLLNGRNIR